MVASTNCLTLVKLNFSFCRLFAYCYNYQHAQFIELEYYYSEKDKVFLTRREIRCLKVQLKRVG